MLRKSEKVTKKDKIESEEIRGRLGIKNVLNKIETQAQIVWERYQNRGERQYVKKL